LCSHNSKKLEVCEIRHGFKRSLAKKQAGIIRELNAIRKDYLKKLKMQCQN